MFLSPAVWAMRCSDGGLLQDLNYVRTISISVCTGGWNWRHPLRLLGGHRLGSCFLSVCRSQSRIKRSTFRIARERRKR